LSFIAKANFAEQIECRGEIFSKSFKDDVEKFSAKFEKEHLEAIIEYYSRGEDYYTFDHTGFSRNVVAYVLNFHGINYYELWNNNCSLQIKYLADVYANANSSPQQMFFVEKCLNNLWQEKYNKLLT
jgi:hypothetical protein